MSDRSIACVLRSRNFSRFLIVALVVIWTTDGWAGFRGNQNAVGGVSIDAEGVVRQVNVEDRTLLLQELRKRIQRPANELAMPTELRMVSLKGLEAACEEALRNNMGQLPDEVKFLAGLQRIQYVFVFPEENDIVLAGPGEGWKVRDDAAVVGITSGRPVMQLDDLLVALRQVQAARRVGISVSIDPTPEGIRRLTELLDRQRKLPRPPNPVSLEPAMKQAFGPQQVRFSGVPETSHFARVLLAADYRMKRLAMKLDPSPVKGLASYLDLIKNARLTENATPRWWLACNYEPVARSEDGLAWELRGQGVKALTEESFLRADGQVAGTGRTSGPAQQWADALTTHYEQLSQADAVFGELRNLMDMCVVAALIEKNDLLGQAGCSLPVLLGTRGSLTAEEWHAPRAVEPQCSFVRTRSGWIVTASGGVQIESWQVAGNTATSDGVVQVRSKAKRPTSASWWW